ncbi:divergent polysaccharide deacetylase family protein [Sedimenticola hydrogenitrophicus]|uniref:divergent polysaccharide deacetylase family protein n=1 Tax=Sedimenticola hydrogenitrophicus TaxID=2967975 RepID=UPI0021A413D7|nr:divergent polysaccharide deacetylase family protein [Sedimenticola hydrogenitrophicus]
MSGGTAHRLLLLLLCLVPSTWTLAAGSAAQPTQPVITIIIDDMGNDGGWGDAALTIPGPVTYAFLPHTPHARRLALEAHAAGKQVMLHLPMQSHEGNRLGPGALTLHMTETAFKRSMDDSLGAIPHARGLNNHMGSLLTRHPGAMAWVMQGLRDRGDLFFIDSRTTLQTVGQQLAEEYGVPNARRDVFLDNDRNPEAIARQFEQLLKRARRQGYAIAIGHPYPETTRVLVERLAGLQSSGIRLIPASEMIEYQRSTTLWHASSSPLPTVAKSSKP